MGSIWAFLSFIVTAVALGIDLGLFIAARHRLEDAEPSADVHLNNATWMVLAACVAILLASLWASSRVQIS